MTTDSLSLTSDSCPEAVLARLLRHFALRQLGASVLRGAAHRQDDSADARGNAGGLEYVHGVLSSGAADRICICAFGEHVGEPKDAGRGASGAPRVAGRGVAVRAGGLGAAAGIEPGVGGAALARLAGGTAVLRGDDECAAVTEMVHLHRACGGQGSLLPVRREQSGKPVGAAAIPDRRGTLLFGGSAERAVDGGLLHGGGAGGSVRTCGVAHGTDERSRGHAGAADTSCACGTGAGGAGADAGHGEHGDSDGQEIAARAGVRGRGGGAGGAGGESRSGTPTHPWPRPFALAR